ncbi:unnamed protein product [Calicophoron daubneyi]|uniref:Alpha-carbonic anhydrase domain-containing protein n=1 Tax=Calicophoron daubneyi TaxID=300641 RepID=A0AAV2TRK9_CALDB
MELPSIKVLFSLMATNMAIFCESATSLWHESTWSASWDTWWHYKEGVIGGPSYWGHTAYMAYAEDVWPACRQGKMQSPIRVTPSNLTFDRNLRPLTIIGRDSQVDLEIHNTGQDVRIEFLDASSPVMLTGGPLSYDYKLFGALLKFGLTSNRGSDHQIDGYEFPAELYAFNLILYSNFSMAVSRPNGIAAISIFLKVADFSSADLSALLATAEEVQFKGQSRRLNGLLLSAILPSTEQYMTYPGSIPFPACHETVTWILLNQAVGITETQLKSLRELRVSPFKESGRMADNFRPVQSLNHRSVRTNIDFSASQQYCSMQPRISYLASSSTERPDNGYIRPPVH